MSGDAIEAQRRRNLASGYVVMNPQPKLVLQKKVRDEMRAVDFLNGYDQACIDLLTPKETPGQPATAITLLNRIGEMVLKNRAELLSMPLPRPQCAGCFCMMEDPKQQEKGWCVHCEPHAERLTAQCLAPKAG